MALELLEGSEAVLCVEVYSARLRVDDHARAANLVGHLRGELEHETQELRAQPHRLRRLVDGETREPEHWQGVAGEFLPRALGQVLDIDVPRRHGSEAEDAAGVDSDIRHAEVVFELVLARVPVEESIEGLIARLECRAVVRPPKGPNFHHASVRGAQAWARPTRPDGAFPRLSSARRRCGGE